jgi:methylmalonyl-CoA/ethylmalonyl-CoA epimerase
LTEIELDHVAIGMERISDAQYLLEGVLGGRPYEGGPAGDFASVQWEFAGGGRIEILEPTGPVDGFLHRFLKSRGPRIHHVTLKVPSLERACERAEARGYAIVGFNAEDPHWREAFLHPKQALGIVVQLAEMRPPQDGGEPELHWPLPEGPERPTSPATLLGPRLSCRSADAARRQWSELLGGDCTEDAEGLTFHWPDSPLRIAVRVDGSATEGPEALEVTANRPLSLSPDPYPEFGTRFVQR